MSSGFFTYNSYELEEIKQNLLDIIDKNEFSSETIEKFKETKELIELTLDKIKKVDYLLSGDTGEETFNREWSPVIIEKQLSAKSIEKLNNSIVGDIIETELGKLEVKEANEYDSCYEQCILYGSNMNCNRFMCAVHNSKDGNSHAFELIGDL